MVTGALGRAFFRACGTYSKICDEDRGVVATNGQGRWLSNPSWSSIESAGASVTMFEGVIDPGSSVGWLSWPVLVLVLVVSDGVDVGFTRMLDGIQLLLSELVSVGVSVGVGFDSTVVSAGSE